MFNLEIMALAASTKSVGAIKAITHNGKGVLVEAIDLAKHQDA